MNASPTAREGASETTSVAASPYAVKLPAFEGPLDLLLHLIRQNEVEITDIPIALIGEQYLAAVEVLREQDLDIAGEYLLMAATLAWIKSRMLLPPDGEGEEGEVPDPRAELIARLLEYQRFKEAAGDLFERRLLDRDVYRATFVEPPLERSRSEREIEVGLFELVEALRRALRAAPPSGAAHEVETETITVRERMLAVMEALELAETLEFEQVLAGPSGVASRPLIVATFLAILELCRLAALGVYQGTNEAGMPAGPIHLRRLGAAGAWRERIAEIM